ncbi:MAG: hypothetical protein WC561_05165 [Candidatus Omnitrophota bacterium]
MAKLFFPALVVILFFHSAALPANDYTLTQFVDINDDSKRQNDETRKTRQILEQARKDIKFADDAIRRERYEEKLRQEELRQEALNASREKLKIQLAQEKASRGRGNTLSDIIFILLVKYGLYLLLPACAWFFYYYGILLPKRRKMEEEELSFGWPHSNLLAVVNNWRFSEEEYKIFQDKFLISAPAGNLDASSPEFKKHFINDLAHTEIFFQEALNRKLDKDSQVKAALNKHKVYFEELFRDTQAFPEALNNYKLTFKPLPGANICYASYYKDFLKLLMLVNHKAEAELFALYGRLLLIEKLSTEVASGPLAVDKIQQEFDKIIDNFKQQNKVLVSGGERPGKTQKS